MRKPLSYQILRLGLGVTFLWIGVMIFQDPIGWSTFIKPWAARLIPVPLVQAMQDTAALDVLVGALLLSGLFVWAAAALGALHLTIVLVTVGVNATTVRDVGLLAASLSLAAAEWPAPFTWAGLRAKLRQSSRRDG